jgi:crotonobetainyl-CoA:carnitine CoA-transferase CaiB-like acyl-CoA transferase
MSMTPGKAGRIAAPGEHTRAILSDLGLSDMEIERLQAEGVC